MTTYELKMPSSYALMDNDEMEYLEGGANGWWNKRSTIAGAIDIAIAVYTLGQTLSTIKALRTFLKKNKNKLVKTVSKKIIGIFGSKAGAWVSSAFEIAMIACGTSIGGLVAYGIDYIDGKRLNGYCFG